MSQKFLLTFQRTNSKRASSFPDYLFIRAESGLDLGKQTFVLDAPESCDPGLFPVKPAEGSAGSVNLGE